MTNKSFVKIDASWTDPESWSPSGAPGAGDMLTVAAGTVTLDADDLPDGTLDSETLMIGSIDQGKPATLSITDATLGSAFVQDTVNDAPYVALTLAGTVTLAGTFDESSPGGATHITLSPNAAGADTTTLTGTLSVSGADSVFIDGGTFDDDGTITVNEGTLTIGSDTKLQANATIVLSNGGTLVLDGPSPPGLTVKFADGSGTLVIGESQYFSGEVTGFQKGDSIVFASTLGKDFNISRGILTVVSGADGSTHGSEIAHFHISGQNQLDVSNLFLSRDGNGNSLLSFATHWTWGGGIGSWYSSANWTDASGNTGYPSTGDTATIASGTAQINTGGMNGLDDEIIVLQGSDAGLQVENGILGSGLTISARADATAPARATPTLTLDGQSTLSGRITSSGTNVDLHIVVGVGDNGSNGDLTVTSGGLITVANQALIDLHTGELTNNGLIKVYGQFTVGSSATLDGVGTVLLDDGKLVVKGAIGSAQHIDLSGGINSADPDSNRNLLVIDNATSFEGVIDNFSRDDKIDVADLQASSLSYNTSSGVLTLLDSNANALASLTLTGSYDVSDFQLASDGASGSMITEQSHIHALDNVTTTFLPIPIVIPIGGSITLQQLLVDAFGSGVSSTFNQAVVASSGASDLTWAAYWDLGNPTVASWSSDGSTVPAETYRTISSADWSNVTLTAGSAIETTAQVLLPTSWSGSTVTGYTSYEIETVGSQFHQDTAPPSAAGIVAAAEALNDAYQGVPNAEDCYNIAAQVGAAAGATFSACMYDQDPTQNVAGGFWRIAYSSPQIGTPVSDWSNLVQAGDVMRIGWSDDGGPHAFTILQGLHNGKITVFDNGYQTPGESSDNETQIGIHDVSYWNDTDPTKISIFRLDADGLFLIPGSALDQEGIESGEILHGNAYNDLFIPGEQADTIVFGTGTDLLADVSRNLNDVTLVNLANKDSVDITDMDPATANVGYDPLTGQLTLLSGTQSVTITTTKGLTGRFTLAADGGSTQLDGGTLGTIYSQLYASGSQGTRLTYTETTPTSPAVAMPTGADASVDPDALTLVGTGDVGTTVTVTSGGATLASATVFASGWSLALPDALSLGVTSLQITETNALGTVSAATNAVVTRSATGLIIQAPDALGIMVTSSYDSTGLLTGYAARSVDSGTGAATDRQYTPDGVLQQTTTFAASGLEISLQIGTVTTLFGHDATSTVTATVTTDVSTTTPSVVDGASGAVIVTGSGGDAQIQLLGGDNTVVSQGTDTISGGSGDDTISAASGSVSVTGGSGLLHFTGSGAATVTGGTGSSTISGGAGGLYIGGNAGNNVIHAGSGSSVWGGGAGDQLFGGQDDLLGAARGNTTLVGGVRNVLVDADGTFGFTGQNATVYGAQSGSDVVVGTGDFTAVGRGGQTTVFGGSGSGTIWAGASHVTDVAGTGTGTLVAGSGESVLWINQVAGAQTVLALNGAGGGSVDVVGFRLGTDSIHNVGYTAGATQSVTNGSLTLTFTDHTSLTFLGVTSLG